MLPNVIAPNCHRQNTFIGLPPAHFYCPLDSIFPAQFRNNAPTHHFYETTKRVDGVIKYLILSFLRCIKVLEM